MDIREKNGCVESSRNKCEINSQEILPGNFLVLHIEFWFYFPECPSEMVVLWYCLAEWMAHCS